MISLRSLLKISKDGGINMKYILTKNYQIAKVKNNLIDMSGDNINNDWYQYLHPEEHFGFKLIHKDNVILEAKNQKELVAKIKADEVLRQNCLSAWQQLY